MESIKLKTPVQLWEGYDPNKADLEINILNRQNIDGIERTLYSFTAIKADDGRARVTMTLLKRSGIDNMPVVLYIPSYQEKEPCGSTFRLINKGFAVAYINYSGDNGDLKYPPIYPKSLSYGYYSKSQGRLFEANYSVDSSSLHIWCKVMRRAITMLGDIPNIDANRICGMAWGDGANILWQIAGIDNRLKLIVPILNSGYGEYSGYYKYSDNPEPIFTDERARWTVGLAVQSYAKSLLCDAYVVSATNDKIYAMDRCEDTVNLIPSSVSHRQLFADGLCRQVYNNCIDSIIEYITERIGLQKDIAEEPQLQLSVNEGKLIAGVVVDHRYDSPDSLELYYCSGEYKGEYRNWKRIILGVDIEGQANSPIRIFNLTDRVYVFATVKYKGGLSISSQLKSVIPSSIGADINLSVKGTRIIYERKMGINSFFPAGNTKVVDRNSVITATGPLDIMGVGTTAKLLVNYNIGEVHCDDEESLLQIDIYSAVEPNVKVSITDGGGKEYFAEFALKTDNEWTRVQLHCGEFKDCGMLSLKGWTNVKILKIYNANAMIINNILWV